MAQIEDSHPMGGMHGKQKVLVLKASCQLFEKKVVQGHLILTNPFVMGLKST